MIAVDTNVLVRLIVADDVQQAEQARKLLDGCIEEDEPCFVSLPVLCELEWVLDSVYRAKRREVAAAVEQVLLRPPFLVEAKNAVKRAISRTTSSRGGASSRGRARRIRSTGIFDPPRASPGCEQVLPAEALVGLDAARACSGPPTNTEAAPASCAARRPHARSSGYWLIPSYRRLRHDPRAFRR